MTRFDDVGLWWEDYDPPPKARASNEPRAARIVAIPDTGWVPPRELPNLSGVKVLGLDTETKDLELLTRGPGFVRGAAHVVGVSVATEDAAWYFPLRHEYEAQKALNTDPAVVFRWLSDLLETGIDVVGANLLYDLEALRAEGVAAPRGRLHDVQIAAPLLDEEARTYSLDSLGRKYLGMGKDTPLLYQWCADSFGGEPDGKQRANIWRAPPSLVGPYAEADARLPLQIMKRQVEEMRTQDLLRVYDIECRLVPLLLEMRFRGVPINIPAAERMAEWLRNEAAAAQKKLGSVDVWSAASVARAFDLAGVEYPRTEKGAPSFTKGFLDACEHDIGRAVADVRMYEKAANPFVESYLLGNVHKGRVHCQFHPLRSDDYGTVSGRLSSSKPNLQNIPSRHPVIGPAIRSLFVPDRGYWRRGDYSQIEYRLLVNYATGTGADGLRERYNLDPLTDFHTMTVDLVRELTGVVLNRTPAKNLNFGLVYGMAKEKTTASLGVSSDVGERLYEAYHRAMPSVKNTYRGASRRAERRGYIRTLLGRRRRYARYEESRFRPGTMQRAGTHTALNACLQGGAADIIKKAMVDCYEAGLFAADACGIPYLTVHDELDWDSDESPAVQAAFAEAQRTMTSCVKLRVPLMLDMSVGKNWGECK